MKPAVSIKHCAFTRRISFLPHVILSILLEKKINITLSFVTVNNPAAPHFSGLFPLLSRSRFLSGTNFVWVERYQLAGCYILAQFLDRDSVASMHDYKFQS